MAIPRDTKGSEEGVRVGWGQGSGVRGSVPPVGSGEMSPACWGAARGWPPRPFRGQRSGAGPCSGLGGGGAEGLSSRAGCSITLRKLQGNSSMSLMYRVLVGLALLHSGKLLRYRVSRL